MEADVLPPLVRTAASGYAHLLRARFGERLLDVRVFGSYARGDADEDSDLDVAVVVRDLTEAERTVAIDLAWTARGRAHDAPIVAPLVWSDRERDDRLRAERRIARDILAEGIPL